MFHHYGKKPKLSARPLKELTAIVSSDALLAEEKRSILLEQIKAASGLEDARFRSLCLTLCHNFANQCQSLPETSTSYYSQQGGVLDYALNRTEAALSLFQNYLIQEGQAALSEEQNLWQYALLSAAVLKGVGKLQTDYSLSLYDSNGQALKEWKPLLENLVSTGSYYTYDAQKALDEKYRRGLNLLLARQLMPASGFAWIASNVQVLAVWLALLNEDAEAAGTLGAILIRANAIAIQRFFSQLSLKASGSRGVSYGRIGVFAGVVPESASVAELEQQAGIEFIQWMTRSLSSGQIMINEAPLYMVPEGLLISVEMFKWFVREHPEYKTWESVQKGFLSLGLHRMDVEGKASVRFAEQNASQKLHRGIVLKDYAVALDGNAVQVRNPQTGKTAAMSPTELVHQAHYFGSQFSAHNPVNTASPLTHLNAKGQWRAAAAPKTFLGLGAASSG